MVRRRFEHFKQSAAVHFSERFSTAQERELLEFILANAKSILAAARRKLKAEWDTFAEDQGVDPFASHSRIEIHLDATTAPKGKWALIIYWETDDSWDGMHLHFDFVFGKAKTCDQIF